MGTIIFLIVIFATIVWVVFTQLHARQQIHISSRLDKAEAARVVQRYFGPIWTSVPGSGQFNYRPKLRRAAPVISVSLTASVQGCDADIWTSEFSTQYGMVIHATLMWRKKRGLAARLVLPSSAG